MEVQLHIDRFKMIDQFGQVYGFDGYLRAWWRDPRLAYNASDLGCAHSLHLTLSESLRVWRPSFYWEASSTY